MNNMKAMARREAWAFGVELVFHSDDAMGRHCVAEPLTMREVDPSYAITSPTVRLSYSGAQALMDELWTCGLRPSEGTGSAGSLAATERHLSDMRAIVASAYSVPLGTSPRG